MEKHRVIKMCSEPIAWLHSLVVAKKNILTRSGFAWIPATSNMQPCMRIFACRQTTMSSMEYPLQKCSVFLIVIMILAAQISLGE